MFLDKHTGTSLEIGRELVQRNYRNVKELVVRKKGGTVV